MPCTSSFCSKPSGISDLPLARSCSVRPRGTVSSTPSALRQAVPIEICGLGARCHLLVPAANQTIRVGIGHQRFFSESPETEAIRRSTALGLAPARRHGRRTSAGPLSAWKGCCDFKKVATSCKPFTMLVSVALPDSATSAATNGLLEARPEQRGAARIRRPPSASCWFRFGLAGVLTTFRWRLGGIG